jgi:hypothetical protein
LKEGGKVSWELLREDVVKHFESISYLQTTMSEKLKEFIDIPQQFIRDGNQVSTAKL